MSTADTAISVKNLSKTFKLPHEKQSTVKGALLNVFSGKKSYEEQHVLKDISFDIQKGEFFGIVGRNGSGKSTLLKLLAGIYFPDQGTVDVEGKLTPFIELGVGFNPDLTGRENVFLNGALLGFNRKEMTDMYDEIVEFAELGKFMDQKLRNYSSGMQVRLAFSIAIRAKSDILVLDEVLAVGDEAFQQKCIDVFENYKSNKQTIVLVTHDMNTIRRFCSKAVLIDEGKILEIGKPNVIANRYSRLNFKEIEDDTVRKNSKDKNSPIKINTYDSNIKKTTSFDIGDEMKVKIEWPEHLRKVKNLGVSIIKNSGESIYATNTLKLKNYKPRSGSIYSVDLNIGPGKYYIMAGLFGDTDKEKIAFIEHGPDFIVKSKTGDIELGLVRLNSKWLNNGEI